MSVENQEAIFAMGCFWCGETAFRDHDTNQLLAGIISLSVGYAGGEKENPTYESHEGHREAVKIVFDPSIISYEKLLRIFWHNIDPTNEAGQFCDIGFAYTTAVFFKNTEQKTIAENEKINAQTKLQQEIATEILPFTTFYEGEDYHQNFKAKNPTHYQRYRVGSGRDKTLSEIWGNEKEDVKK